MAHRSGGGSHHGGSHHHSSGSHGSGSRGTRRSSHYFSGARKYRYYDRRGNERFVYMNRAPHKSGSLISLIFSLIFLIPFIVVGVSILFSAIKEMAPQNPLEKKYESPYTHIDDRSGVIGDEVSLENALVMFEEKTGICPYFVTVDDESWQSRYSDFDDYAFSSYYELFNDEQHFLVMYSQPAGTENRDNENWVWEAIQGDETDPYITEKNFNKFEHDVQYGLDNINYTIEDVMQEAFENASDYMIDEKWNMNRPEQSLLSILVWNGFVLLFLIVAIRNFLFEIKDYTEVYDDRVSGAAAVATGIGSLFAGNLSQNAGYQNNSYGPSQYMGYQNNGYGQPQNAGYQNNGYGQPQNADYQNNSYGQPQNNGYMDSISIPSGIEYPEQRDDYQEYYTQPETSAADSEDDTARRIRESYRKQ